MSMASERYPMRLSLSSIDYKTINEKPVIHLFCRDYWNKRQIIKDNSFLPYFYIKENDVSYFKKETSILKIEECSLIGYPGEKILKVTVKEPRYVRELRNKYKNILTYEADILFPIRYLIDKGIKTGIEYDPVTSIITSIDMPSNLKYLIIDIETFSKKISNEIDGKAPVIVIGIYSSETGYQLYYNANGKEEFEKFINRTGFHPPKYLHTEFNISVKDCNDEKSLFYWFNKYLEEEEPDIIITFTPYDLNVIISRMRMLGLDSRKLSPINIVKLYNDDRQPKISGIQILDASEMYRKIIGTTKWETLDAISIKELGYGRIFHDLSVYDTWLDKENWWKILARCLRDIELVKDLNNKLAMLEYFDSIRRIAGINFRDSFYPSRVADVMYLRHVNNKVALPTKSPHEKIPYKAAVVKDIVPGVYKNILVVDWKALYSSSIRSFNIGYDTWDELGDMVIDENHKFRSSPKSWSVCIVEELLPLLEENKKHLNEAEEKKDWNLTRVLQKRRLGIKEIVHGVSYGYFVYAGDYENNIPASRLYFWKIGESVALPGRILMQEGLIPLGDRIGYPLIYGDTDSAFFQLKGEDLKKESEEVLKIISKEMKIFIERKWNVKAEYLELDIDYLFKRLILVTKKRYKGITLEGEIITKGLDIVRSNSANISVEIQGTLTDMILKDKRKSAIKTYVKQKLSIFKSLPLTDIATPEKLTQPQTEYRSFSKNLQAFLVGNQILKLDPPLVEGERFYILYGQLPRGYRDKVIGDIIVSKKKEKPIRRHLKEMKVKVIGFRNEEEIPKDFKIDYEKMKELTLKQKIQDILALLGIKWEDIDKKEEGLNKWIKN